MKKIFILLISLYSLSFGISYNKLLGQWQISNLSSKGSVSFGSYSSYNTPVDVQFDYGNIVNYSNYQQYFLLNNNKLEISKYPPKNGKFRTQRSNDIYEIKERLNPSLTGGYKCYRLKLIQKGMGGVYNRNNDMKMCKSY